MMGAVLPRVLAGAATAWTVAYLVAYLWLIEAQDGAVAWWYVVLTVLAALSFTRAAWWYVVLTVLAALSFTRAALGIWARAALTVGLVTAAFAMLIALLSLGALLAPTVVAAAIALLVTRPGANAPAAADEPQPSQQQGVSR
jgi:hypothetical protein